MPRIIFITGTDTGVGKTVVTSLLLAHLRAAGRHALGLKPFCSGSRKDAEVLAAIQQRELQLDEVNPFYFPEPVAPLLAGRKAGRNVPIETVLQHIQSVSKKCDCLLIEGAGGLLVPLGEGYNVLNLIVRIGCEVFVVTPDRLGTVNQTLLTVGALKQAGQQQVRVALKAVKHPDLSCESNAQIICELIPGTPVQRIPFLKGRVDTLSDLRRKALLIKTRLANLLDPSI